MKGFYQANAYLYCINLALYISVIGGMIFQILLGAYQVIATVLIFILYRKSWNQKAKKYFGVYLLLLVLYVFPYFFQDMLKAKTDFKHEYALLYLFIIPMLIGGYNLYMMYELNKIYQSFKMHKNVQ